MSNHFFVRRGDVLYCEAVPLNAIASAVGTPCYVYSRAGIENAWQEMDAAFGDHPHTICYAVKANGNLAVLDLLARLGSGFDIVSGGELQRVLCAGGDPAKVVFSGVAKSTSEIEQALQAQVHCIDIESGAELERVARVAAAQNVRASIALRVNPDVDPETHPYIATGLNQAKFGIPIEGAFALYQRAAQLESINVTGVAMHIGSQIVTTAPFTDAVGRLAQLVCDMQRAGIELQHVDIGGGLGIRYRDEEPPTAAQYIGAVLATLREHDLRLPLIVEPGRSIVGNAGVLLTKVEYLKSNVGRNFAIVDAGMNDLLRPALYQAWQGIETVVLRDRPHTVYDVVGPICETGDVLGQDRELAIAADDLLAVMSAGAYGASMSSNYNARPRPAEVMVDGDQFHIVRQRESVDALLAGESMLPR